MVSARAELTMPKVKAQITVSLDGYMAGPNQSEENPLGEGGESLHEWIFRQASFNKMHGRGDEGERGADDASLRGTLDHLGAVVMGRNMFGPVRGEWGDSDWNGWWGDEPPFHVPVFVLTHHQREPLEMDGGTTFYFVSEGVESAIVQAKEVAGDLDVSIGGGAATIQQVIAAGLLDQLLINQAPILLGGGERLLDGLAPDAARFELADLVKGPEALHLTYRVY